MSPSASSRSTSIPLVEAVSPLLQTRTFGRTLRGLASVPSTNTVAFEWAREGAPEGSVVYTDFQTAGRGRQGRTWEAAPGLNLMFSVVLRPSMPASRWGLIGLASALAIAEAVDTAIAPHRASIKWPNDVLLEGRKCCGLLVESALGGTGDDVAVLGVGLNVNQTAFPPELEASATSLALTAGRPVDRVPLFTDLLSRLEDRYAALAEQDAAVREAYRQRMHGRGQPVCLRFSQIEGTVRGTMQGIDVSGALLLQTETGLQAFHAGEVTTNLAPR